MSLPLSRRKGLMAVVPKKPAPACRLPMVCMAAGLWHVAFGRLRLTRRAHVTPNNILFGIFPKPRMCTPHCLGQIVQRMKEEMMFI
jgi:hypothetical protein